MDGCGRAGPAQARLAIVERALSGSLPGDGISLSEAHRDLCETQWRCPVSLAFAVLAANVMSFNCVVDPPRNVTFAADGSVTSNKLGLPPEMNQWAFGVTLQEKRDELNVTL